MEFEKITKMEGNASSSSSMVALGDVTLTCKRCSVAFKYSTKDQTFYKSKGFAAPKFCGACRLTRKEEALKRGADSSKGKKEGEASVTVMSSIAGKRKSIEGEDDQTAVKRSKHSNDTSGIIKVGYEKETDQHKIETRLKQVQYGYNTAAYDNYIGQVPKNQRSTHYDVHPRTPDPYMKQSKRSFDGRLRKWRRELHRWDPKEGALGESVTFKPAPKSQTTAATEKDSAKTSHQSATKADADVDTGAVTTEENLGEENLGQFGDDSAFGRAEEGNDDEEEDDFL